MQAYIKLVRDSASVYGMLFVITLLVDHFCGIGSCSDDKRSLGSLSVEDCQVKSPDYHHQPYQVCLFIYILCFPIKRVIVM